MTLTVENQPETLAYVRNQLPWHGIGKAVGEFTSGEQMLRASGLDWETEKRPLFTDIQTNPNGLVDHIYLPVPDRFAHVRLNDGKVLGVVSDQYQILPNRDMFRFIDELFKDMGLEAAYESAGALRDGKTVFTMAKLQGYDATVGTTKSGGPDVNRMYLLFSNSHDGGSTVAIQGTNIRVVCWNTHQLALKSRKMDGSIAQGVRVRHDRNMNFNLNQAKATLLQQMGVWTKYIETGKQLAGTGYTPQQAREFLTQLFPPIKTTAKDYEKAIKQRQEKVDQFMRVANDESRTLWGLYSAATGYADHQRPRMKTRPEARMISTLWGEAAELKDKAWMIVNQLVEA